jgi:hypothetical protein
MAQSLRMKTLRLPFLVLLSALSVAACAAAPAADSPPRAFAWLSGHWCSQSEAQLIEEYWMPPEGNLVLGVGRTVKAGKTVTFEFMRIATRDGATNYLAMHDGLPAVAFRLTASGADWARFENPQHDFPTRVEYRRTSSGLHAEIAGPGKDGKEVVYPFDYRRCVD